MMKKGSVLLWLCRQRLLSGWAQTRVSGVCRERGEGRLSARRHWGEGQAGIDRGRETGRRGGVLHLWPALAAGPGRRQAGDKRRDSGLGGERTLDGLGWMGEG